MCLERIKILHRRSGESAKERARLFKKLKTMAERNEAVDDAIECSKSTIPFGGNI